MRGKSKVNLTASEAALFLVGFLLRGGGQHLLIQPHVPSPLLCLTAGQATLRSFHFKSEVILCCAGQSFRFRLLLDFKSTQLFFTELHVDCNSQLPRLQFSSKGVSSNILSPNMSIPVVQLFASGFIPESAKT